MFQFNKIWVLFGLFIFCFKVHTKAQKIDIYNYENKAQAYAILSAQYSTDAYTYSRKNLFLVSTNAIKQNCDTGIVCAQIAIEYADSAVKVALDTCDYAKTVMFSARESQKLAIQSFKQIRMENNAQRIHVLSEKSMYAMGNATVDAYDASLFFEGTNELNPVTSNRNVTRLESDEFSYLTIKELYGKRLIEIEDEIASLDVDAKKSKGQKLIDINNAISQLKDENKALMDKIKNSKDRLVSVRNELSEEMLKVVNKDIFTTEKLGFYNENVPVPVDQDVPKGLVYRVQIGFFKSQLPPEHFEGIFPISKEKIDKIYYRYLAGNFSKYEDVKNAKIDIAKKGYTDSFVVAYLDGEKIPISEALKKEKETN